MKKAIIFIGILSLSAGLYAQQLSFRFANPRIIRLSNAQYFQFDVQVKCSYSGTYLWASQIKLNFNNTTFNTTATNWGVTKIGAFDGNNSNFTPTPKYAVTTSMTGTPKVFNLGLTGDVNAAGNGPNAVDFAEIPTDWTSMVTISARLVVTTGDALAGIDFLESGMNGFQQYISAPSIYTMYNTTNLYDSRDFMSDYTGRFFSTLLGWSQINGPTNNSQYLNWATSVSTTVWENAAISQTDNIEALANHLLVESGATLTIPTNKWLTVAGNLTINGGATSLVVASGGSLIQNTAGVQATVARFISGWGDASHGWHLLSSPLTGQPFQTSFVSNPPSASEDFYYWDESTAFWINSKSNTVPPFVINPYFQGNFEPGKGYLVAYSVGADKIFNTGTLNVANVTRSGLTYTPSAPYTGDITPGWNLLGNPYSSALTWNNGSWTLTNVDGLAQIWNEVSASYTVISANGIIPAMQGFMVHVPSAAGGAVAIPASARAHNGQAWYKATGNPFIKLVASNPGAQTAQESVVTINSQATPGYDGDFDSYFLQGYAPQFYSVAGDTHFAYNTLPGVNSQTVIPFNFNKTDGSDYTIEATQIENLTSQVYLTDLKINKTQNLIENPVYDFTAFDGDDPARFLLTFGQFTGNNEITRNNNGIYTFENNLYIVNPGSATLEVYNLTGQKLQAQAINSPGLFKTTLYLPTGYYVVRLTTQAKVVVTKVFLKS